MRKLSSILMCLIGVLFTTACFNGIYYWEFYYEIEDIESVRFVEIESYNDETFETIQIIEYENWEECLTEVCSIEMRRYGPSLTQPSGISLLVKFKTGDYDLISEWAPIHHTENDTGNELSTEWMYFDNDQFNSFLMKWLE